MLMVHFEQVDMGILVGRSRNQQVNKTRLRTAKRTGENCCAGVIALGIGCKNVIFYTRLSAA